MYMYMHLARQQKTSKRKQRITYCKNHYMFFFYVFMYKLVCLFVCVTSSEAKKVVTELNKSRKCQCKY